VQFQDNEAGILEVTVTDNGAGIKEADMSKLFQLYGFIKETREINTRGIGLGLYICRKIVRQLGGEIVCES
jgi:signal transduction histidine kinase